MDKETIIAIISFLGTFIGGAGGIIISSKLTNHRIEQLEIKVDKHNSVIERTFILETKVSNLEREVF